MTTCYARRFTVAVLLLGFISFTGEASAQDVCASGCTYTTIQAAIDAEAAGATITVGDGTYVENVTINKNLTVVSQNGRASTTIEGISSIGALGTVVVTSSTSAVQIGDTGQGFTIEGIDNGLPGIENAAVYFRGGHSGAEVIDNEIMANGDHGLLTEFGAAIDDFLIDSNTFSGQTFLGATPGGCGFGSQFTTPNVPRQLVTVSGGSGGGSTSNVTFTNNMITGTAGGPTLAAGCTIYGQGNTLATIDSDGATITGNTFAGTTARFATSLRTRGPSTTISGNNFDSSGLMPPATAHVFVQNTGETLATVAGANTFDKGVYVDGTVGVIGFMVEGFVEAVGTSFPAGSTVHVLPGTYVETGQIHATADVTLSGADRTTTTIMPGFDTSSSGDARGFFLVDPGVEFHLSDLAVDGSGQKVWQGIRHRGSGSVTDVDFRNILFDAGGPSYAGNAIAAFGDGPVDVLGSTFSNIGRIGVLYFGSGVSGSTFADNTYTGKGDGDFLDYALDISAGASITVEDNTISGNRGVASSDGSTSAGILVTTFFAAGTTAVIDGNEISHSTSGVAIGFDDSDGSSVTMTGNAIHHNEDGVRVQAASSLTATGNRFHDNTSDGVSLSADAVGDVLTAVFTYNCFTNNGEYGLNNLTGVQFDAELNSWGSDDGPSGVGPGSGDAVSTDVDFDPWLLGTYTGTTVFASTSNTILEGTFTDSDGNPLAGEDVLFLVDGTEAGTSTTDGSGVATLDVGPLAAGDYNVDIILTSIGAGCVRAASTVTSEASCMFDNFPSWDGNIAYGTAEATIDLDVPNGFVSVEIMPSSNNILLLDVVGLSDLDPTGPITADPGLQDGYDTITYTGGSAPSSVSVKFGPQTQAGSRFMFKVTDKAGCELHVDPQIDLSTTPESVALHDNYPNPFNPTTTISFELPERADVNVAVYDVMGRQVKTLVSRAYESGRHDVQWDGTDAAGTAVASGIYFYRFETGSLSRTKQMILLK